MFDIVYHLYYCHYIEKEKSMTQFNTDITLDIRGHEFKIEIYGDVDRRWLRREHKNVLAELQNQTAKRRTTACSHIHRKKNTATK